MDLMMITRYFFMASPVKVRQKVAMIFAHFFLKSALEFFNLRFKIL